MTRDRISLLPKDQKVTKVRPVLGACLFVCLFVCLSVIVSTHAVNGLVFFVVSVIPVFLDLPQISQ